MSALAPARTSGAIIGRFSFAFDDPGRVQPQLCFVAFDAARFEDTDLATHRVTPPDGIARWVRGRRAEFLAGRLAARDALASIGHPAVDIPIGAKRAPVWPTGVTGSISHTDGLAVALVARAHRCLGVGVDIESVVSPDVAGSLRASVVSPREEELVARQAPSVSSCAALTIMFSAKESFFKAVFATVGSYLAFDVVDVVAVDLAAGLLTLQTRSALHDRIREGERFRVRFCSLGNCILTVLVC